MTQVPLPDMPDIPRASELVILAGLRRRYLQLGSLIEEYTREREAIKDRVRLLGYGEHAIGEGKATVSPPTKTFNPELASEVLREVDVNLVATCSVSKVDSAIAKRVLSPALYERCQKLPAGAKDRVTIS